jgi:multidrug efflux pump subunit AcrB
MFLGARSPKVLFFPENDPEYVNILAELPIGMDVTASDSVAMIIEEHVERVLKKNEKIVKSVLTTVGLGAKAESDYFNFSETPNQFLLTVTFVDYEDRGGVLTSDIMKELSDELIGEYANIQFSIEKNSNGPPTGKPINLEISGKDFQQLLYLSDTVQQIINHAEIEGIEGLKIDLDVGMPEMLIHIDREKSRRFGLSTGMIASTIRTALFGKEVSDFKVGEDEYPIVLRLKEKYRNDISSLMNMKVTFRSQSSGKIIQIPVSAVATFSYNTTYGAVKRKDLNRMITIYSNIIEGYNATEINNQLKPILAQFPFPEGYDYQFTGEQEEQEESMAFLLRVLLIAVSLIAIILVSQFNSVVKPFIIIMSVVLSTIGVLGGIATFKMDFIVIMTGIGIVSLAGVVVNNAIVLIDYINLTKMRKKKDLGLKKEHDLKISDSLECIVFAGKIRLRPVLLTAITTILGLLPMAIGINIDFVSFLNNLDPKIYLGGDMTSFWGAFSWTVIFGLSFATFLTLIIVPSMYHVLYIGKSKIWGLNEKAFELKTQIEN